MKPLILASSSLRRREILQNTGFAFHTFSLEISENIEKNISLDAALLQLSRRKAEAVYQAYGGKIPKSALILSADTVVVFKREVLGKPKDQLEATNYLKMLSGNFHEVKTAFCLWDLQGPKMIQEVCNSRVYFKNLSSSQIDAYVKSSEPYDKAGGYGIQGKARDFVDNYTGSYWNIVGLPIERILEILNNENWEIKKNE